MTIRGHSWGLVLSQHQEAAASQERWLWQDKAVLDWDQNIPPWRLWPSQSTARAQG